MKKISIIYSFRNEADLIPELIKRTVSTLEKIGDLFEIIFVDDCSTDNSKEIILREMNNNNSIKLLAMKSRFGQMPCIIAGLEASSGDCAIFLDSDLQDPPELFIDLINEFKKGFDVVHTVRSSRKGESFFKMFLTKLAYKFIRFTSKLDVRENAGDFKLISRNVINDLLNLSEEEPYLRTLIPWMNSNCTYVEYERDARFCGETHFSFWGMNPIETFFIGLSSFSTFPLYIPFLSIGIVAIICVALLVWVPVSLATILIMLALTSCFILFSIGCIGIYLARIFRQTRNRPLYLIEKSYGFSQ